MPRLARTVFADVLHHITQRGNRREDVFFSEEDRHQYLEWLGEYYQRFNVEILAYCLMTNHIHLVLVPSTIKGLHQVLRPLHMRYAQFLNKQGGWKGHVWQGRYFSSPLDEHYTWAAIRYVERNPVRADMVRIAEEYPWSSAAGHCALKGDPLITSASHWQAKFKAVGDWSAWLTEKNSSEELKILRGNVEKGLPCGSSPFISKLEKLIGRPLAFRPQGRPRKEVVND